MKYCPSCRSTYTDDTLEFCLQDGDRLSAGDSTLTQNVGETETVVRQALPTSDLPNSGVTNDHANGQSTKRANPPLVAVVTAVVMCIGFGALIAGWWIFKDGSRDGASLTNANYRTPIVMPSPSATIIIGDDGLADWGPIQFQASLDGERLTYYPGTTYQRCQEDCNANQRCRGFTFINQGTYNPQDSAMCYLVATVTNSKFTASHISRVKR